MPKKKTADYTRKAIEKYQSNFERFTISLPIGSKEKITSITGKSLNQYFNDLYLEDMKRRESE